MSTSAEIAMAVAKCRQAFKSGITKSVSFRKRQLKGILRLMKENEKVICSALKTDLGRDEADTWMMEVMTVTNEIVDAIDNVKSWASDEHVKKDVLQATSSIYIRSEPYGVCLIMAAYNYPFALLINPLVAAIAAGNCAVLKTSEAAVATAELITKLLPQYIDATCYPVVNLDATGAAMMLKENRFDLIFFTGGTYVGKLIMKAAAENLTPVVLELGGKNPCFVDSTCNVDQAAKRIVFCKYSNAGQICLSPDYVLCDEKVKDKFVAAVKRWINEFYGENPQKCANFSRIISQKQTQRLQTLIESCRDHIACGGDVDVDDKYVSPTVVCDPDMDSLIMSQEVFGPIMIVLGVKDMDEGIEIALKREKPLALYAFSNSRSTLKNIMNQVQSGGVTLNDCMMHYVPGTLPFGGVGHSGFGAYHGKHGFDTFSHKRSVYDDGTPEVLLNMRYPPLTQGKISLLKMLVLKSPRIISDKAMKVFILALAAFAAKFLFEYLK